MIVDNTVTDLSAKFDVNQLWYEKALVFLIKKNNYNKNNVSSVRGLISGSKKWKYSPNACNKLQNWNTKGLSLFDPSFKDFFKSWQDVKVRQLHKLAIYVVFSIISVAGFSIDLNFQDAVTSELKNLDVNVQNSQLMQ